MKKVSLAIILLSLLSIPFVLAMPAESKANDFVEIVRDKNALYSLNIRTLEDRVDHVVAWLKFIPRGATINETKVKGKKIDYNMIFVAANKNRRQLQSLSQLSYINGSVVDSYENSFAQYRYQEVVPGTYGETIYDAIIYTNNKIKEIKDMNNNNNEL